jgi:hypothetical protein
MRAHQIPLQLKSGLAPTGVLRQMPVLHNSSQFSNIRRRGDKRQTTAADLKGVSPATLHRKHLNFTQDIEHASAAGYSRAARGPTSM